MNTNDKIILGQILEQQHQDIAPTISESEFFEIFVAEQILKEHDLSYDELEAGITDGGGDGGIDAMYVLVNEEMLQEGSIDLVAPFKKNDPIEVVIVQAKLSDSFKEDVIDKLILTSGDIFDLGKELEQLKKVYNAGILSAANSFRTIYKQLATKFPQLHFRFIYASTGSERHPNVVRKADMLKKSIQDLFSNAECKVEFLGASELLVLARRHTSVSYELALAETPISSAGEIGYVCLVRLRDYDRFIRDESGQLRRNLFDANVRDYQGSTEVNKEIAQSLRGKGGEDFWWLNNGITVIAEKATQSGKMLALESPQIVNGLQTSTEISRYFSESNTGKDDRNILVRVIVPTKPESRDRIIKATNSQTSIPPASLRATEKIHRDIEEHLSPFGLYYDRRKNYYKNKGQSLEKIVSIPFMAQAVMAILLQRPNDARARPSSLLKKDTDYEKIFSTNLPIRVYLVCASIVKKVGARLRLTAGLDTRERNNLRFYIAMWIAALAAKTSSPSAIDLAEIDLDDMDEKCIDDGINSIRLIYDTLKEEGNDGDLVAKGPHLVEQIKTKLAARINSNDE